MGDIGVTGIGSNHLSQLRKQPRQVESSLGDTMRTHLGYCALLPLFLVTSCAVPSSLQSEAPSIQKEIEPESKKTIAAQYVAPLEVRKDMETWSLPTEILLAQELQDLKTDVEGRVVEKCMHGHGFTEFVRPRDAAAPNPETSPRGRRIFNKEIAKKFGYHESPDPGKLNLAIVKHDPGYGSQPQAFHDQWAECRKTAQDRIREKLGIEKPYNDQNLREKTPLQTLLGEYEQLSVDTFSEPLASAKQRWQKCMAPLGIADLPNEPWMRFTSTSLPPSLVQQWGWEILSAPTAQEIQVAVHDAGCREESRWNELYYEAEWQLASSLIQGKEDLLKAYQKEQTDNANLLLSLAGKL